MPRRGVLDRPRPSPHHFSVSSSVTPPAEPPTASPTPTSTSTATLPDRAAAPREDLLTPGTVLDRYTVLEKLGSGGMAEVYAAYDAKLDRRVALKLLLRVEEGFEARLLREAQAMARLSHPNVVAVFDTGQVRDRMFLDDGDRPRNHAAQVAERWPLARGPQAPTFKRGAVSPPPTPRGSSIVTTSPTTCSSPTRGPSK